MRGVPNKFKQTEIGLIPEDWEVVKLGEVAELLPKNFYREETSENVEKQVTLYRDLVRLYWDIGKLIFERQQQFSWGRSVVGKLAKDLQKDYSGSKGFSARNLWDMRRFYIEYKDLKNLRQLVAEIPWGQNLVIMSRVKNIKEKEFHC